MTIKTPRETFVLSQAVPNLIIKNVVWGTKYIMYEGNLHVYSPDTGYCANINMREEEGQLNVFDGHITLDKAGSATEGERISEFHGLIGREGFLYPPGAKDKGARFFDRSGIKTPKLKFLPRKCQSPFESIQVWRESNLAIVANDIVTADTHKKRVEAAQRVREKQRIEQGLSHLGRYFEQGVTNVHRHSEDHGAEHAEDSGHKVFVLARPLALPPVAWKYRDNFSFDEKSLLALAETVAKEEEELARQKAEAERLAAEQQAAEGDGSCVIS